MVEHGERDDGTLPHPSVSDRRAACLQFERAWRAKEVLGIEEFAAQTPYEVRGKLLTDLIACEMSLRTAAGELVDPLAYRRRFPDCPSEVDAGYQQFRQRAAVRVEGSVGESEDDLVRFLDDYLADLHDGRVPDKAALLAAHPSIADKLEGCLAGIDFLHHTRTCDPLPDAFGRYAVLSTLGRGAFGVVCLARDTELNRLVALKVPPEGRFTSADEIDRFMVEARTAAQLEHPGIVAVHDVFRDKDRVVIVQQYVEGQDLRRHLEQSGPLPVLRAVEILIAIADAVALAHRKGIVHRDLKPGNILLDEQGLPHVADFGLALHKSVRRLAPGDRAGTPEYMSPEQVSGETEQLDGRSDIWSLGVVLYEMLTGRRPFGADRSPALFDAIRDQDPAPLRQIRADVPAELERICLKCLSKQAAGRYAFVEDLARDLRQFAAHRRPGHAAASVAVLPFADACHERDQEYFCEGMTEELIGRLANVEDLKVASRAMVQRYRGSNLDVREIGRQLGVGAILQGVVRKSGGRLCIAAELVNVLDGCHLWSERFDREMKDVFFIQKDIACNIVRSLELTLSAPERQSLQAPPTTDPQAYDYYLKGRKFFFQYRRRGMELALRMFSLAIQHDEGYARAYAGIADCNCFIALHTPVDPGALERADAASRRALELAPDSPEAHVSRGNVLSTSGRRDEAEAEFETALRLGPRLFDAYYLYARACFAQGKLEKAVELYRRAEDVNPLDYQAPLLVAQSYDRLGLAAEARAARLRGVETVRDRLTVSPDDVRALYMGANALMAMGNVDESLEWANLAISMEPDEPMVLYNVACIYSLAGRLTEAMEHLERSVRGGLRHKGWLEHDDNLDPLRNLPRFQQLLKEL